MQMSDQITLLRFWDDAYILVQWTLSAQELGRHSFDLVWSHLDQQTELLLLLGLTCYRGGAPVTCMPHSESNVPGALGLILRLPWLEGYGSRTLPAILSFLIRNGVWCVSFRTSVIFVDVEGFNRSWCFGLFSFVCSALFWFCVS